MSTTAPSLYSLEENYLALLDTAEFVTPESEAEFRAELANALKSAVEKRDKVGQFVLHCEAMAEASRAEQKRLAERAESFDRAAERMKAYVLAIIEEQGADLKGKMPKLDGNTLSFSARACPEAVEVTDIEKIPSAYKSLTFTVPAAEWERHIENYRELRELVMRELARAVTPAEPARILSHISKPSVSVDKAAVKKALKDGVEVPGADLSFGKYSLQIK